MTAPAQYSPFAREDIDSAAAYIAEDNPQAAHRFLHMVQDTVNLLVEFPELAAVYPHPNHPGLRAKLVNEFRNYIIFYTVHDDRIYTVRVLHGSRDIPRMLEQ